MSDVRIEYSDNKSLLLYMVGSETWGGQSVARGWMARRDVKQAWADGGWYWKCDRTDGGRLSAEEQECALMVVEAIHKLMTTGPRKICSDLVGAVVTDTIHPTAPGRVTVNMPHLADYRDADGA